MPQDNYDPDSDERPTTLFTRLFRNHGAILERIEHKQDRILTNQEKIMATLATLLAQAQNIESSAGLAATNTTALIAAASADLQPIADALTSAQSSLDASNAAASASLTAPAPTVPVPTNLVAVSNSSGTIDLTFDAPTSPDTISLFLGTASGAEGTTAIQSGLVGGGATLTGLVTGTEYFITAQTVDASGNVSAMSAEASATAS